MADIINNPPAASGDGGSGMGMVMGIVVALLILVLLFMFALPMLRGNNAQAPTSDTNIKIPDTIDINVNK